MYRFSIVIVVALAALGFGCNVTTPQASSPDVVAVWRGGEVTRADLEAHILSLPEERRRPEDGQDAGVWRRRQLDDLLVRRTTVSMADDVRSRPAVSAEVEAARHDLLVSTVRQRKIAAGAEVTEEELRAFYEANPDEFGHEEQVRLRHIFLRVDRDASEAQRATVRARMEDLLQQLRNGGHFGDLARLHSESETARVDGLIGRLSRGTLGPKIEALVFAMDEGEISDVVPTPIGFHIFQLVNHVPAFKMPFEEAKTRLTRRLTRERTEVVLDEFHQALIAASGATIVPMPGLDADPEMVLFAVGEERLTLAAWRERLERMAFPVQRAAPPEELLFEYTLERLILWHARQENLAEEPEIAAQLAALEARILQNTVLRDRLDQELSTLGDEAMRAWYETVKKRFQTPRLYDLALLTQSFPDDEQPYRLFEDMQAQAARLRAGEETFAQAARRLSDDVSAYKGGEVGPVRLDAFLRWSGPDAQASLIALGPGEISDPILIERYETTRLQYAKQGYMLIKLVAVLEAQEQSYDDVRARVRDAYLHENVTTLTEAVRVQLLEEAEVHVFEANL